MIDQTKYNKELYDEYMTMDYKELFKIRMTGSQEDVNAYNKARRDTILRLVKITLSGICPAFNVSSSEFEWLRAAYKNHEDIMYGISVASIIVSEMIDDSPILTLEDIMQN